MIKIIEVAKYVKSGFSIKDAETLAGVIHEELRNLNNGDVLQFDFVGVKFFTTLFFNVAFASLLNEMTYEDYAQKIRLVNLSEVGQTAYQHSIDNAKRFSEMSPKERDKRKEIIYEILKEKRGE